MSEMSAAAVAELSASSKRGDGLTKRARSRRTNRPLSAAGNTSQGRRIRDLYRAYAGALGNPDDPGTQAQLLAAVELAVAAETARAALLAGRGDVDQVIRLENLSARALRRLGLGGRREAPSADFSTLLPDDAP
jgi:hypothetical protein